MNLILVLSVVILWRSACCSVGTSRSVPLKCAYGTMPCRDGSQCLHYSHFCDGEQDCKDGSDEDSCALSCKPDQFQCKHGKKCIESEQVCDGEAQCQDRSDEMNCLVRPEGCALHCENGTHCVPETFLCDGERDCADGADEAGCALRKCGDGEFRCTSGQCISTSMLCDGYNDCRDRSDEEGCALILPCPSQRRCPDSQQCLLKSWVCDGEEDCQDGSDEKDCRVTQMRCGAFQWSCASGTQCVPRSWRCDGEGDCKDHSDEAECGWVKCPSSQFQCGSGECRDLAVVCDGALNCPDGSDEGGACLTKCSSLGRPGCTHDCFSSPQGMRCACREGFELQSDNVTCVDVDECKGLHPAVCSHTCQNTPGTYLCHCLPGFQLEPNGHSCNIKGTPLLLASVQDQLLLYDLQSASLHMVFNVGQKAIISVDYDWREQKIFWVNLDAESIRWTSMDQKEKGNVLKGIKSDCIAIDWVGRNLYWVDGVRSQIRVIGLVAISGKSQNDAVVLDEDLEQPQCLALMPQRGIMFWSEIGSEPQIERAGMDGSDRKVVVRDHINWPLGLAVDPWGERVYWTDEKLRCIGSATLDGLDIKILQLMEMPSPFSVVVFNDIMYWSDTERRKIQMAHKDTGKDRKTLARLPGQPFGLKVIHQLLQGNVSDPCAKLRCSHLCLLAPGPRGACHCPSGMSLADDGFTCTTLVESAFLLFLSPTSVTQVYLRNLLRPAVLNRWPEHSVLSLPGVNEATALDMVVRDQVLYLADAGQATVWRYKLKEGRLLQLRQQGPVLQLQGDVVTALAVDWVTLNLYWSSTKQPKIYVTSAQGGHTATLGLEAEGLVSIALHPPAGRLCFTGMPGNGTSSHIQCAFMDGRNSTLVWPKALGPTSLTFSSDGSKLYWADTRAGFISSIGVDGSGYEEFALGDGLTESCAYVDGLLFWATINDTTKVWYSDGVQPERLWFKVKTGVVSLKAYSKLSQKGTNRCSERNGDCSHLCLPFPGGRTCRCTEGHISVDVDCVPCPPGSKSCRPDCLDPSDKSCTIETVASTQKPSQTKLPSSYSPAASLSMPTPLADDLMRNVEAATCSEQLCHGRGRCIPRDDGIVCECPSGWAGEFCQNPDNGFPHAPLVYGAGFFCASVVIAAVVFLIIRRRTVERGESVAAKETGLTEISNRNETVSEQTIPNETEDPAQELVSPVD